MRKVLIGLGVVVVVLVAAVFIGPSLIDVRSFVSPVLQSVREATGREVKVGDVKLSILPSASVTLKDLRVANIPGAATPDMVRINAVDINLALMPLLSRRVEVQSITIVDPTVQIETLKDGRSSLDFPKSQQQQGGGSSFDISVQNITLRNGAVVIRDAAGGQKALDQINVTASADSLSGPFKAKGTARAMGVPANLDAAVGKIEAGKPANVNIALDGAGAKAQFGGTITGGDKAQIAGKVALTAANLSEFAKAVNSEGGTLPPLAAQSFTLEGNVRGTPQQIQVADINVALGDMRGTGAFALGLGDRTTAQLALNLGRIDLDKLLGQVSAPAPAKAPAKAPPPGAGPMVPPNLVAAIDIGIEGIAYRGQAMQKARLLVDVVNGVVTVKQLSAQLPANSNVLVANLPVPLGGKPPAIPDGRVEAHSDNLRGLLEWLGTDVSTIPSGRLLKFDLKAGVKSDGNAVQITGLDATLDATRLTGNASMAFRDRPAFTVNAKVDKINVDNYMPVTRSGARQTQLAQAQPGGGAPAQTPPANPMETLKLLERFDLNLQTEIQSLTFRETPIQDLKMNLELVDGKLTIKEATVRDVAGAQAAFTLMAEKLSTSPAYQTAFNLRANDAKRFLKFATGYDSPLSPQALGSLTAKGTVAGTADQLKIDTQMEGFGGAGKIVGNLAQLTQAVPKVDLNIDANFPEFGPVLGALMPNSKHGSNKLGPFALKSQIANSGADAVVLRQTELRAFGGDLDVDGTIGQLSSPTPSVDLGLKMNMPSLKPLLTAFNPDPQLMASADRLGGLAFNGRATGNANKVTLKDAALNGLGGSVKLNGDILQQGKQYDLNADIQNFNVGPLLAALPGQVITAQGAQQMGPLTGRVGLKGTLDNLSVAIQNANMRAFGGTLAANGTVLDALDPTRKADLTFDIAGVHAGQLLAAFPAAGASPQLAQGLQTLNAKGSIKGSTDAPSVTFNPAQVQAFGGFASLNGTITDPSSPGAKYDMTANIDMPSLMNLLTAFYKPAQPIQGPVKFQNVKLVGDGKKVQIQNLVGQLGTIGVNGTGSLSFEGPRPKLDLNLNTNGDILLDAFLPADEQKRGDLLEPYWKLLFPDLMPAATQLAQGQARPLHARWSRQPMGLLQTIKAYDANISIAGQTITQGPYQITGPQAHATISNGQLVLDKFVGTMFDGQIGMNARINAAAERPTAQFQGSVKGLNVAKGAAASRAHRSGRKWFLAFGRVELTQGTFNGDFNYNASGRTEAEMVQSLAGDGSLSIVNGVLEGFDMKKISETLKHIENVVNLAQIMTAATSGGQTNFQSITSTNKAQNGLLTSSNLLVKADAMEGRGGYNIDFPSYTINAQMDVFLIEHQKTPPIHISAVGPLDQPQTNVNKDALQQHVLAQGTKFIINKLGNEQLKGILGGQPPTQPGQSQQGAIENVLKGVLGGQQQQAAPAPGQPAPAPAPQPARPQDQVKGLLQQLLKPPQQ